jgi:hypothetical protein
MTVQDAAEKLGAEQVVGGAEDGAEVRGGYASDLLSDVIANAAEGSLWITLQKHVNIVAVAHLKGLAGIVLVNGRRPEPETLVRAAQERLPILVTPMSAFDAAGVLHANGIRGGETC